MSPAPTVVGCRPFWYRCSCRYDVLFDCQLITMEICKLILICIVCRICPTKKPKILQKQWTIPTGNALYIPYHFLYFPVLRIHAILGWIRIRILGSMPLTNVSGSGFGSGSWIQILLFSSWTFKMPAKNLFFNTIFSAYYFLKLNLHHFSKISQKE